MNRLATVRTFLARAKRKLLKKPFLKDPRYPPYWIQRHLGGGAAMLVQIGSNDGKTGDPFYPILQTQPHWRALFVEPIPVFFEKLQANYPDTSRFSFENAAINDGSTAEFFWLDPAMYHEFSDLPYWYEQLGSFDRAHIEAQVEAKVLPYLRSAPVQGMRLAELLDRHGIENIDILHIDAEGYDWTILSQLDLTQYRPAFILYEAHHLSPEDQTTAANFLADHYRLFQVGIDALAVRKDLDRHFLKDMSAKLKK